VSDTAQPATLVCECDIAFDVTEGMLGIGDYVTRETKFLTSKYQLCLRKFHGVSAVAAPVVVQERLA
jgi:hypothetical protein